MVKEVVDQLKALGDGVGRGTSYDPKPFELFNKYDALVEPHFHQVDPVHPVTLAPSSPAKVRLDAAEKAATEAQKMAEKFNGKEVPEYLAKHHTDMKTKAGEAAHAEFDKLHENLGYRQSAFDHGVGQAGEELASLRTEAMKKIEAGTGKVKFNGKEIDFAGLSGDALKNAQAEATLAFEQHAAEVHGALAKATEKHATIQPTHQSIVDQHRGEVHTHTGVEPKVAGTVVIAGAKGTLPNAKSWAGAGHIQRAKANLKGSWMNGGIAVASGIGAIVGLPALAKDVGLTSTGPDEDPRGMGDLIRDLAITGASAYGLYHSLMKNQGYPIHKA